MSVTFGTRLYAISKRRRAVAVSLLAAVVAAILILYRPSLLPPGLHSRELQIGAASTQVMVTTPSLVLGASAYDYESLVNTATLVGNVMVSPTVLSSIGHAVGVDPSRIQATAPMTAQVPRALLDPGGGGNATDILASPDHYKLEIQADPSVPVLHIYAQAPTKSGAIRLANASVVTVSAYLQQLQTQRHVPMAQQVRIQQLGAAQGGIANPGAGMEIALLAFVGVFGVSLWLTTLLSGVRRGWVTARLTEQPQL